MVRFLRLDTFKFDLAFVGFFNVLTPVLDKCSTTTVKKYSVKSKITAFRILVKAATRYFCLPPLTVTNTVNVLSQFKFNETGHLETKKG